MKQALIILSLLGLTACGGSDNQTTQPEVTVKETPLSVYKRDAKKLVEQIRGQASDADIEKGAKELVAQSQGIIKSFMTKYPQCDTYLNALNEAASIIPTLSLAEIESGYHEDGKLPQFKDPICYHAKDLLVHPATVQVMANQGLADSEQRTSAEHEIVEVIAHFSEVEKAFNKM